MPPARPSGTSKRTHNEVDHESDEDYDPEPASTQAKSPKPQKTKATKTTSPTSKRKPKEAQLERIPKHYFTDSRARFFTGQWYREVMARDEFWEDFNRNAPAGVLRRRLGLAVDTTWTARNTARNRRSANPMGNSAAAADPAAGTVVVQVPVANSDIACHVCNKTSDNETDLCNACLAQEDDGFRNDIMIKSEGKRETKLREKPFGTKVEPLKIEDDESVNDGDHVKVEENLEDDFAEITSNAAPDESPVLIKLEDGRQALMTGGAITMITRHTQLRAG